MLGASSQSAGELVPSLHTHPCDSRTGDQRQQLLFHISGAGGGSGVPGAAPAPAALPEHASHAATLRLAQPADDQGTAGPHQIVGLGSVVVPPPDTLAAVTPRSPLLLLGCEMPTNIPDLAAPLKKRLVCWEEEAPRSRAFAPRDEPRSYRPCSREQPPLAVPVWECIRMENAAACLPDTGVVSQRPFSLSRRV